MIPRNTNLIKNQIRKIQELYPEASDKELYFRFIDRYYVRIPEKLLEKLLFKCVPSMDTVLRRLREIREEKRKEKLQTNLF